MEVTVQHCKFQLIAQAYFMEKTFLFILLLLINAEGIASLLCSQNKYFAGF